MTLRSAVVIATAAVACTAAGSTLVLTSDHGLTSGRTIPFALTIGLLFVGTGLVARWRRPTNRTGLLMILVGFTWFIGALGAADSPLLFSLGFAFGAVNSGVLTHLLLAYPSGRLEHRVDRVLVVVAYAIVTVGQISLMLFNDLRERGCADCPRNVFLISRNETADTVVTSIYTLVTVSAIVTLVVILTRRWRQASPALRRALTPVYATGGGLIALIAVALAFEMVTGIAATELESLFLVLLFAVPLAFLFGLLRTRLAHRGVSRLVVDLPASAGTTEKVQALRSALRDPTLEVAFWVPEAAAYVDVDGRPATLAEGGGRATTRIDGDEGHIAAFVHDEALLDEPELLESVVAAARLGLERERFAAELRARLDELQRERDFVATVVNNAPTFFCVVDETGSVVRFNDTLANVSGIVDNDAARGRPFWEVFIAPDEQAAARESFSGAPALDAELPLETRSGDRRSIVWSTTPLLDAQGRQRYLLCGLDVTELRRQELDVRRERDFGHAVTDATPSLLIVLDDTRRIISEGGVNLAAETVLGYSEAELGGRDFVETFIPEADAARVRAWLADDGARGRHEHESEWVARDRRRLVVAWSCTPLREGGRGGLLVCGTDITERKRHEEDIRASRARIVAAADEERRRLERNLHDGAQQRLVALSLGLRLAQAKLRTDPAAAQPLLATAADELALALEELRELARGIHPAVLTDRGLAPALEALAARSPVPVEVDTCGGRLPGPVETAAYYVVSEALANVAKYSQASQARVSVERGNGRAVVEVSDDGVGGADPSGGSGLRGLSDRVAALDGRLSIQSPVGDGTRIRAEIPLG